MFRHGGARFVFQHLHLSGDEMRLFGQLFCALVLSLIGMSAAAAMSVSPMSVEMAPSGPEARETLEVSNTGSQPLPVEVVFEKLEYLPDGTSGVITADDEVMIFPPQAMIAPGRAQTFRLQYAGDPAEAKAGVYFVTFKRMTLDETSPEQSVVIKLQLQFRVTIFLKSGAGEPDIQVVAAEGKTANERSGVELTLRNDGADLGYLSDADIHLSASEGSEAIDAYEVLRRAGHGVILPGRTRKIFLTTEQAKFSGPVAASLSFKDRDYVLRR